jgi:hypothetical protein
MSYVNTPDPDGVRVPAVSTVTGVVGRVPVLVPDKESTAIGLIGSVMMMMMMIIIMTMIAIVMMMMMFT